MALGEYQAALKLGRRQYQEAVLMGKSPYLPVLDEILEGKIHEGDHVDVKVVNGKVKMQVKEYRS